MLLERFAILSLMLLLIGGRTRSTKDWSPSALLPALCDGYLSEPQFTRLSRHYPLGEVMPASGSSPSFPLESSGGLFKIPLCPWAQL